MECVLTSYNVYPTVLFTCKPSRIIVMARPDSAPTQRRPPKNLRYPRRAKLPPPDPYPHKQDFNLNQQDCTTVMKVCVRLRKFEIVETLYKWFKESGREPSIVMYTTLIHSRYSEMNYREAMAVVWEMERLNCIFDLPAYRVVIKLFVALNDFSRALRYYSRLKEAGFTPTYDIYRDLIMVSAASGRLPKCKEVCKEVELAGFKLDKQIASLLLQIRI